MIRHRKADEIASGKEVKPHPLWKFFRVPDGVTKELDEGVTAPPDMGSLEVWASIEDNLARGMSFLSFASREACNIIVRYQSFLEFV